MARILGLDIDEHAIRAAWLESSFRSATLDSVAYAAIGPSIDDVGRAEAFREAARQILASSRKPPDQIVVALDGTEVSLRPVSLAPGLGGKIGEVLPHEIAELLPFDLDDLVIDHQILEQSPTVLRVLCASARKETVKKRLDALREAGFEPRELAAGAAMLDGLGGLIPALATGGPHLLVHVGEQTTDVCILRDGRAALARTLSGGADLIDSARVSSIAQQLARTVASYRSDGGDPIAEIHVSGVRDCRYVSAHLESALAAPAAPTDLPAIPGVDAMAMPAFARAIALASRSLRKGRRFDLRKGEFAPPRAISGLREHRGKIGFGVGLIFVSFLFSAYVRYSALDEEHTMLTARLGETTNALFGSATTTLPEARELLEGGSAVADPRPRMDAFQVLDAISAKIPDAIRHQTFRLRIEIDDEARDGTFEISGVVPTINDRDTIATGLEGHECVVHIDRGPTTPAVNGTGQNYRLEGNVQCPGDEPIEGGESGSGGGH